MPNPMTQAPPGTVHLLDCGWVVALAHVAATNNMGPNYDDIPELHIHLTTGLTVRVRTHDDRQRFYSAWERWQAGEFTEVPDALSVTFLGDAATQFANAVREAQNMHAMAVLASGEHSPAGFGSLLNSVYRLTEALGLLVKASGK